ncbi:MULTISPECIES: hypothetical protein [Thermogemmatispora]|nr:MULTISPECIES: hypothetical protein [Thermogemmatispora]
MNILLCRHYCYTTAEIAREGEAVPTPAPRQGFCALSLAGL